MHYPFQVTTIEEYQDAYRKSIEKPEDFWGDIASWFTWRKKWDKILDWNFEKPDVQWFINSKLNITENCIDRHLETKGDEVAILWEPNDPAQPNRQLTYRELHREVCKLANVLKN